MSKALMRTHVSDDDPENLETAARLMRRLHAERPAIVLTATDTDGNALPVRLRDVHAAIERALPNATVRIGRDFFSGREHRMSLHAWHALVEQRLQDLTMRVRALEAAQTIPLGAAVPPPAPVERIVTIERDADRLITRTRSVEVPLT